MTGAALGRDAAWAALALFVIYQGHAAIAPRAIAALAHMIVDERRVMPRR
jgi:hypothetical protein